MFRLQPWNVPQGRKCSGYSPMCWEAKRVNREKNSKVLSLTALQVPGGSESLKQLVAEPSGRTGELSLYRAALRLAL